MKKILPILLLVSYACTAQNYECLQTSGKHYFINANGYLRGIRIDSVKTLGTSILYYPFHTPRGATTGMMSLLDSTGGSWLGKQVKKTSDGTYIFDSYWNDSVVIKTQSHVGDSWTFYSDTSELYYKATTIAIDTMSLSGTIDSIKKILITARNMAGIVTTDPLDSIVIILSKNNGFVQVFDLYTFPYHLPGSFYTTGLDYYLDIVNSNAQYPIQTYHYITSSPIAVNTIFVSTSFSSPTVRQLTQWHLGDVYEFSKCEWHMDAPIPVCDPVQEYDMDTIISSSSSSDFDFSGWKCDLHYAYPVFNNPYYVSNYNSGTFSFSASNVIDTTFMPEEMGQSNFFYYMPNDSSYNKVGPLFAISNNYLSGATLGFPIGPGAVVKIYKFPFGLLHSYDAFENTPYSVDDQTLIYYNKSGDIFGSYVSPLSVDLLKKNSTGIDLYPNPVVEVLNISAPDEISRVVISNLHGQVLYNGAYQSKSVQIDLTQFTPGMYLVKINGIIVRKFIKR